MEGVCSGFRPVARWAALIGLGLLLLSVSIGVRAASDVPTVTDAAPVADAGPDRTVDEDVPMAFDGSGSTDDLGIANYTWLLPDRIGDVRTLFTLGNAGGPAAFDPVRPLLYVEGGQRVDVVNLSTGAVDRGFLLAHTSMYAPTLAVAPKGGYLIVTIPTGQRGYYYFGPYDSFLATVDLVNQTKVGEFFIAQDASSAGVSDDGYAIVTGGSGQWADVRVYNAKNGTALPREATIWQYNYIAMHPSGRRAYSVETAGLSTLTLARFDFNATEGISAGYQWPYWGSYPGPQVWISPAGDFLVTGSGMLLALNDIGSQDMAYVYRFVQGTVTAAAFDSALGLIAVVEGTTLNFFDAKTYERLGWAELGGVPSAITFRGDEVLAVVGNEVRAVYVPRGFLFGVAPSYTFSDPGVYTVILRVTDTGGMVSTDTVTITVRDVTAPVALAGPDQTVIHGRTVYLHGNQSYDNVGIASHTWQFEDGGTQRLYGSDVWYRFDNVGTFLVTLTVTDFAGNPATDTMTVTATLDAVAPLASAGPARTVYEGNLVRFDGSGSSDNVGIATYAWTFSDNGLQALQGVIAEHRFLSAGVFPVTLTVTDLDGNTATDTVVITVRDIVLVEVTHPSKGFRIGIPEDFDAHVDATVAGVRVDLAAFGPVLGGRDTSIIVVAESASDAEETDSYVLRAANDVLAALRANAQISVLQNPAVRGTSHTATFEVRFVANGVHQMWGVVASRQRHQVYSIIATVDGDSAEMYRPVFDAVIASFSVVPLPPLEDPVIVGGLVVLVVALVLSTAFLLAWRRMKSSPPSLPPPTPPPLAPPRPAAAPLPGPVAVPKEGPVDEDAGWPDGPPKFCFECGTSLESVDRFCSGCGKKLP